MEKLDKIQKEFKNELKVTIILSVISGILLGISLILFFAVNFIKSPL
jgi:uncharacterized membrane protein